MTRISSRILQAEPEYRAASQFRRTCFSADRSYFWPDREVWTAENVAIALGAFDNRNAANEGSFFERLRVQLDLLPTEVTILAAESLAFYYLFPHSSTFKSTNKQARVAEILAWKSLSAPKQVLEQTFSDGIGGVGIYYFSAPQAIITCFLTFILKGKQQNIDFGDAVQCRSLFAEIAHLPGCGTARNAFLHLAFPDDFEPIVSDSDRKAIIKKYSTLIQSEDDADRALRRIRESLSTSDPASSFSFYAPDV